MPLTHICLTLLVVLLWGVNIVAIKISVADLPPLFACALRFIMVGAILLPFLRWHAGQMRQVFALTLTFGVLHFGLLFAGMAGVDAGLASILIQLSVPFGLLLGWWFLGESFGWNRFAGLVLAFLGFIVVFGDTDAVADRWHVVMVLAAVSCWAGANIQLKSLANLDVLTIQAWIGLVSGPSLLLISWALEGPQWQVALEADWRTWSALVYTAVAGSVVGHSVWYWLVARHPLSSLLPILLLQPVVGILTAVIILDESLGRRTLIGGFLILLGVAIIQLRAARKSKPAAGNLSA